MSQGQTPASSHPPALDDITSTAAEMGAAPTPTQIPPETTPAPPQTTTQTRTRALMVTSETPDGFGGPPSPPSHTPTSSPPLSRCASPSPSCVLPADPPPSQASKGWIPSHKPSWTLGPQHRRYVHLAASYLTGVPGGPEWEKLLANYVIFESLSAARGVSVPSHQYVTIAH